VIYSTHILSEVEELCDEGLVLRDGRIVHREELRRAAGGALRYRLRTRVTPDADLLAGLPGVVLLHGSERALDLEVTGEEALEPLVRRVQERALGLVELRPIERSLDDLLAESEGA